MVAERLREAITTVPVNQPLPITMSIGLAHYPGHGPIELQDLLTRADTAVYQAKATGRDRVHTAPAPASTAGPKLH